MLRHLLQVRGLPAVGRWAGGWLGHQGLQALFRGRIDLILMAINMPGVDGIETAKMLRAHPTTRAIPLIAVTALAMAGDRERILDAGFDDYIAKPFDHGQLLQRVGYFTDRS
ncbi:response regulator [Pseudoduganella sp. R-34]|uniref:response regulator n=1 Tax=Pseudoduganella sp. R-34 TaxID=3404062 RepID=UPI003CE7AE85